MTAPESTLTLICSCGDPRCWVLTLTDDGSPEAVAHVTLRAMPHKRAVLDRAMLEQVRQWIDAQLAKGDMT